MANHQAEIAQLHETIEILKTELNSLKQIISKPPHFSADVYPHLLTNSQPVRQLLAVPLSKVIDVYRECPEILEPVAIRVSLDKEHFSLERNKSEQPLSFHVNPNGNFWVIQLQDQGEYLFPRPGDFKRIARLSYLSKIYAIKRDVNSNSDEFELQSAAKLRVLRIHRNWHLEQMGLIDYGRAPIYFEWQKELENIRNEYKTFKQRLNNYSDASLGFTIMAQRWQQALEEKYGPLMSVTINTSIPIAYAVYRGPVLVPCQLLLSLKPIVLPGWDSGIDWQSSIFSEFHSEEKRNIEQTHSNHPVLPDQLYLRENNSVSKHTWAIAKSYLEASSILEKLNDNWGPL